MIYLILPKSKTIRVVLIYEKERRDVREMTTIGWDEVDPSHLIIIVRLFLAYMFNKGIGECINFDLNKR